MGSVQRFVEIMGTAAATSGASGVIIKERIAGTGSAVYNLVDVQGNGLLVDMMKEALKTNDYTFIDEKIVEEVSKHVYDGGNGKMVPINELITARSKQRQKKVKINPKKKTTDEEEIKMDKFKETCWKIDERGAVGETILHMCLLCNSEPHQELAKRLLKHFPKLINDIYLGEEYYGESVLHMALVNEDPPMVRYLLENGSDYMQRCCGNFFTPEDQKSSRTDSEDQEWVNVRVKTNYEGFMYKGEYPLAFAACLGQEDCIRLLLAKGADPNAQDANGNAVLHMLVIHNKKSMFDMVLASGGKLDVMNRQGLTPLGLAARFAKKDMYEHILYKIREVNWVYGNVLCATYPLDGIDTISGTGDINENSVLNIVAHGESVDHIELMEGVIQELLNMKWNQFIKNRYVRRMIAFLMYFCFFTVAFFTRFGEDVYPTVKGIETHIESTNMTHGTNMTNGTNVTTHMENILVHDQCFLSRVREPLDVARFVLEGITLAGAVVYIFLAIQELYHQNLRLFVVTLSVDPARSMFLMSCCLIVLMVFGRIFCVPDLENVLAVFAILFMAPYFLFFCRGFKFVGLFVMMMYRMITTDLFKFLTIYGIFLMGFSQAMFLAFRSADKSSIFEYPLESILAMLTVSVSKWLRIYEQIEHIPRETQAKFVFSIYTILSTMVLLKMLIAMMEHTYYDVYETKNEFLRQWAKILLVVESGLPKEERLEQRTKYSEMMKNGSRGIVIKELQIESAAQKEQQKEVQTRNRKLMVAMVLQRWKLRAMENILDEESGGEENEKETPT